jgi:hypothetical protein
MSSSGKFTLYEYFDIRGRQFSREPFKSGQETYRVFWNSDGVVKTIIHEDGFGHAKKVFPPEEP